MHLIRRMVTLGLALVLLVSEGALAATVEVSIDDFLFTPASARLRQGDSVNWTNNDIVTHTATSNAPFSLWNSGVLAVGGEFSFQFIAAGKYPYFCTIHPFMTGSVSVALRAVPRSGPPGTVFQIRVATVNAPAGFVYDIQKQNPGGTFQDFVVGTTAASTPFDSTGMPNGTYSFRSRMRKLADGSASNYSQPARVLVG
jgi:plastocyanin